MLPAPIFTMNSKGTKSFSVNVKLADRKEPFTSQQFHNKQKARLDAARIAVEWIQSSGELLTAPLLKGIFGFENHDSVSGSCNIIPIVQGVAVCDTTEMLAEMSAVHRLKGRLFQG
jgi:hypothetical protein